MSALSDEKPTLLVVDDEADNLGLYQSLLSRDYLLIFAKNGQRALELAEQNQPDLVLLDIMMPEMDGFEVMRRLKEISPDMAEIPVLFATALNEEIHEVDGLKQGAVDYITKPVSEGKLKARLKVHLDLYRTKQQLKQQTKLLERERHFTSFVLNRVRHDPRFCDRSLRYFCNSLDQTGGDVVFSVECPNESQYVLVGDFTGHGLSASVSAVVAQDIFYPLALKNTSPTDLIQHLNHELYHRLPSNLFLACCFIAIAADRKSLLLWNFSMPAAYCWYNRELRSMPSKSLGLGMQPEAEVENVLRLEFNPDCKLFVASDGVTELRDAQGQWLGDEGFEDLIREHAPSEQAFDRILEVLESSSKYATDDFTLVQLMPGASD